MKLVRLLLTAACGALSICLVTMVGFYAAADTGNPSLLILPVPCWAPLYYLTLRALGRGEVLE